MLAAFKILFVFVPLGFTAGTIGIPYSLLVGNVRLLYRVTMRIMRLGIRAAGIQVIATGSENVPAATSCIFLANHLSNLDPPIIYPLIPAFASVMVKHELMQIPLLGRAMRMGKVVPVERSNSLEAAKRSMHAASEALSSGLHMLVFAEGTRSRDGRLQAFKKGPFFLAEHTGAPIVPVAISGTERMMRRGSWAITPGVARVQMLPAIDPRQFTSRAALMSAVQTAIANALPAEMRPAE